MAAKKRAARSGGLAVIGIALVVVGLSQDTSMAFIGAGILFIIAGAVSMRTRGGEGSGDSTSIAD